jgi:hypothetical protein
MSAVLKADNKTILIAADIEDGSVVSDEIHVASKRSLQVRRPTPIAFGNGSRTRYREVSRPDGTAPKKL